MIREEYDYLNADCFFPQNVEGYWRQYKDKSDLKEVGRLTHYPWPVVFEVEGYNKYEFVGRLIEKQLDDRTKINSYRGVSQHRLTDKSNGNSEFELDGWKWPSGYISYLTMGVPPSRAFYKFITGEDLPALPTYGRPDA